ncbi:MAG: NUDIX hydrolase [Parcubacteria group bacterium]|nr:NUDIX hydrolase [Parcubacteria group bacterium]
MKTRQRVYSADILSKDRLRHKLQEVFDGNQGSLDHVSVFCVPIRLRSGQGDILTCLSNQRGISSDDLEVCLVFEKREECVKGSGEKFTKPEGWGFPGGGIDRGDFLEGDEVHESSLTKTEKNAIVSRLLEGVSVDDLLIVIERALFREALEEAGLTINPFWGLYRVDSKENEDGGVSIVVTVLAEVLSMSEAIDKKEIKKKRFFTPGEIVMNIKAAKATVLDKMPPWMYVSHIRRFGTMLAFLGRDFEASKSAIWHMFDRH